MINASQIKPNTPVVCSNNRQFAIVDHMFHRFQTNRHVEFLSEIRPGVQMTDIENLESGERCLADLRSVPRD